MNYDNSKPQSLQWTGERYVPEIHGEIELEHVHRYAFARQFSTGKMVLDIACGEGYGASILAETACHVIGVDISLEAVRHASKRYRRPNVEFKRGSCAEIPLANWSVDVVVSFETIEHQGEHECMMQEMKRVLKPSGILVLSSPERYEYSVFPEYNNPFHVKELYRHEFEGLVSGFFKQWAILGQKVLYGSSVILEHGESSLVSYSIDEGWRKQYKGLPRPKYLIAVASDESLPRIESSFLEQALQDSDAIRSWSETVSERENVIRSLNQAVAEREGQIASLSQTVAEREGQIASLSQTVAEREGQIASLSQTVAERDELVKGLNVKMVQDNREKEGLQIEVRALRDSTSWRITAPIRWCSIGLRRWARSIRSFIVGVLRVAYHSLPFSEYRKNTLKGWFYSNVPLVFRRTISYRYWKSNQPVRALAPRSNAFQKESKHQRVVQDLSDIFSYSDNRETYVPLKDTPRISSVIRLIAFYLPQFHSIPENDEWWGKGFTEWRNVTRAKPQFVGHYQPHLPDELGFYDLRLIEIQRRQIELAKMYGIYGFCYHYYWFGGKRLLERPINQVLANKELDFPFCICWANENWTRRWDGLEGEALIGQKHSPEDDLAFIQALEPVIRDDRYIRIDKRPLIIVYRPELLPDAKATADRWRRYCHEVGVGEIYLALTHAFENRDPRHFEFDAAIEFPPNNSAPPTLNGEVKLLNPSYTGIVYDYRYFLERSRKYKKEDYKLFRGVTPGWDNEARKPGRGTTFMFSTPEAYAEWLHNACRDTLRNFKGEGRLVFINAWNEWAEGCHLEPDQRYGYAYLQRTKEVLSRYQGDRVKRILYVSHDAGYFGAQLLSLNIVKELHEYFGYEVDVIVLEGGPLLGEFSRFGSVHDFSAPGCGEKVQDEIIREAFERGARAAITSTTVAGKIVERLKLRGFRIVSLVHELPGIIRERKLEESLQKIGDFADKVVFPATSVRERISELYPIDDGKAVVRPQGLFHANSFKNKVPDARRIFRSEFGIPEDAKIVMGMGYGDYRKGIDLFVETGMATIEKKAETYFVWFGTCDPEAFSRPKRLINERGAERRIIFPGQRLDPDVYFSGADVFFLSSREDPFPTVVLAAMDAGLPVIGFENSGGFCELLEDGGGLLVQHGNVLEAAGAVDKLLRDNLLWQQTSNRAKEIIGKRFQFRDYVHDLVSYAGDSYIKVSVIVPNYNYERYLPERLLSVIKQTRQPYEIIFLDDCSTDGSIGTAEQILKSSGIPFRVISNTENQGTFRQWLRGIREANGDLIWIAEADDYCDTNFLETVLTAFSDAEVVLAYCQSKQVDADRRVLAENYLEYTNDISTTKWLEPYTRSGLEEISEALSIKNTIANVSAVVMKKPDPETLEGLLAGLRIAGDWLTYVEVLSRGKIAYFPDSLNFHRRHGKGVTIGSDNIELLKEIITVQRLISRRFVVGDGAKEKGRVFVQSVYQHLRLNEQGPKEFFDHPSLRNM